MNWPEGQRNKFDHLLQSSTFTIRSTSSMGQSPNFAPHNRVQKWKRRMSTVFQLSHHDPGSMTFYRFEYLWQDSANYKRPTKMPAPEYIEHLMVWVQGNIDNEAMFPSRIGRSRRWLPDCTAETHCRLQACLFQRPSHLWSGSSSSDFIGSTHTYIAITILLSSNSDWSHTSIPASNTTSCSSTSIVLRVARTFGGH